MQHLVADKLADKESGYMARKPLASRLHLLSVRAVKTAGGGDHSVAGYYCGCAATPRRGFCDWATLAL